MALNSFAPLARYFRLPLASENLATLPSNEPERSDLFLPKAYKSHVSGIEAADGWLNERQKRGLREKFKWELEMFGYTY